PGRGGLRHLPASGRVRVSAPAARGRSVRVLAPCRGGAADHGEARLSRRIVVTSVVRYAVPTEMSGWLRVVDLSSGETVFATLVPESVWRRHDPNPRGGTRGTRGVSVHGERLVIAGAERLYVFDTRW